MKLFLSLALAMMAGCTQNYQPTRGESSLAPDLPHAVVWVPGTAGWNPGDPVVVITSHGDEHESIIKVIDDNRLQLSSLRKDALLPVVVIDRRVDQAACVAPCYLGWHESVRYTGCGCWQPWEKRDGN